MVSEMAMESVKELTQKYGALDPRDIVRLNAFGCAVERHAHCGELYALPRVAYLGDVVFHEPTIGTDLWLDSLRHVYNFEDPLTSVSLRAVALVNWDKLSRTDDFEGIAALVAETSRRLAPYTIRQVLAALDYAVNGCDAASGERPPAREEDDSDARPAETSMAVGLLRVATAFKLGTIADLKSMTLSAVQEVIHYASELGVDGARKSEYDRRCADYWSVCDEIAAKMEKLKNGNS